MLFASRFCIYIKPIHICDYYWKKLRRTRFVAQGKVIDLFQVDIILSQEYQTRNEDVLDRLSFN